MSRKAGVITINLNAGTAQFMADMDAASVKVKKFGEGGVSEAKAVTAGMKALEGGFLSNSKAADAFIEKVLGAGPLMVKAFSVVGAVAFAGAIGEAGKKVYEFFKGLAEAPERIEGAFRTLNAPLRQANDELAVANDRLSNDIAKLEGRHENTLKLMIDEVRVAADRLADSLDKDLEGLHKLLDQQGVSIWKQLLTGTENTADITKEIGGETGVGGFRGRITDLTERGNAAVRQAKTPAEATAAQTSTNAELQKDYRAEIAKLEQWLANARNDRIAMTVDPRHPDTGADARIELLEGAIRQLGFERANAGLQVANSNLTTRKDVLTGNLENEDQDRPFKDRMKQMAASIDAAQAKLVAIGQPDAAQRLATAFGEAQKAITEVNKALEKHHVVLTDAQKDQIRAAESTLVNTQADTQWREKLTSSTSSIEQRILAQDMLTAAIGRGYEATKAANVEARLMQELGQHYGDAAWMTAHAPDVSALRSRISGEVDAQHEGQSVQATQGLREQIELERALAEAQQRGAEAVREATLAVKLRQMALKGASDEELAAERELFNAQRANTDAEGIGKLQERIAATQRLTDAILGGAEAERRAGLENQYAAMARGGASPEQIDTARQADQADHQRAITAEALKTGMEYRNQVEAIDQQIARLQEIKKERGDTLAIEVSLRDLENQRIEALVKETLQIGRARDGVKAFFLEMQQQAKTTGQIVYDSLNSALDRTSENLAKAMTGQQTAWGQMFKDVGTHMLQEQIKSGLQMGLGALGIKVGIGGGGGKKDGQADHSAFWVQVAGGGKSLFGKSGSDSGAGDDTGSSPDSNADAGNTSTLSRIINFFLKLLGHGGQGGGKGKGGGQGGDGTDSGKSSSPTPGSDTEDETESVGPDSQYVPTPGEFDDPGPPILRRRPDLLPKQDAFDSLAGVLGTFGRIFGGGLGDAAGPGSGGGGGDGLTPDVTSNISYGGAMAGGGGVEPGVAYKINDGRGQEYFIPSSRGTVVPHEGTMRGGESYVTHIDARGADLGVVNRLARLGDARSRASVPASMRAMHERQRRTVKR